MNIKISITGPRGSIEVVMDEKDANFVTSDGYTTCVESFAQSAVDAYRKLDQKKEEPHD